MGSRLAIAVGLASILAAGCTSYGLQRNTVPASGAVLERDGGFYVTRATDGEYNGKPYVGSGRAVTQAVAAALSKHALRVEVAASPASHEENLRAAREKGLRFVAVPTILHWEDRATEWSGIPDKISVRLAFVDAQSGTASDSAVVTGRSKWATFGGDHPQDLLPGALEKYVGELFAAQNCPTSGCS